MPSLPPWSTTSASSRPEPADAFDWRPSWLQQALLALLAAAAALALLNTGLPAMVAFPAAMAVVVRGAWLLRRERRRRPRRLELGPGVARVDGEDVDGLEVAWRGSLAFLRWRDPAGRAHALAWWPDVLPAPDRRRLRLAAGAESISPVVASVAP